MAPLLGRRWSGGHGQVIVQLDDAVNRRKVPVNVLGDLLRQDFFEIPGQILAFFLAASNCFPQGMLAGGCDI
jgi:hypothetical protein